MIKFDNAFLTKNNMVGMQFISKGRIITVYPDKRGNLHMSENTDEREQASLAFQYARRKNWYYKGRK